MKIKVYASELEPGMELANGNTVVQVSHNLYSATTSWIESDESAHEDWSFAPIDLMQETNCLYGGLAVGHTRGFCTADSCY